MEDYLIEIVFTILGMAFITTKIPQIVRLYKHKTSDDISPSMWWMSIILSVPWVWYAIYKDSCSLFLSNVSTTILNSVVLVLVYGYRIKKIK